MREPKTADCVVVGAGPAYPGLPQGISGADLLDRLRAQLISVRGHSKQR